MEVKHAMVRLLIPPLEAALEVVYLLSAASVYGFCRHLPVETKRYLTKRWFAYDLRVR